MTEKYNGWTNYETWLCKLWMDNDGDKYYGEMAQAEFDDSFADGPFTRADMASRQLADRLQCYWDEVAEQQGFQYGFFAGLINAGLSAVNWNEIARSYIDMIDTEESEAA